MAESPQSPGSLDLAALGTRVRELRRRRGLTLQEVAGRARVSSSTLSDLERAVKAPTVVVLDRVATALGTTISRLLQDERAAPVTLLPAERQWIVRDPSGWERRILSPVVPGIELEMMRTTIPAGVHAGTFPPHRRGSHGYLAVADGHLRLELDGTPYLLDAGDAIAYAADVERAFVNPGREACTYYLTSIDGPGGHD